MRRDKYIPNLALNSILTIYACAIANDGRQIAFAYKEKEKKYIGYYKFSNQIVDHTILYEGNGLVDKMSFNKQGTKLGVSMYEEAFTLPIFLALGVPQEKEMEPSLRTLTSYFLLKGICKNLYKAKYCSYATPMERIKNYCKKILKIN